MPIDELNIPTENLPADLEAAFDEAAAESVTLHELPTAPEGWQEIEAGLEDAQSRSLTPIFPAAFFCVICPSLARFNHSSQSRSSWLIAIRSISPALRLSRGTFYFAQLGTSHFAATQGSQPNSSQVSLVIHSRYEMVLHFAAAVHACFRAGRCARRRRRCNQGRHSPSARREQARSMIVTRFGIVATSQFLASQAGAKMLEAGGNAIDAAIAANAVLGVTQPYVNGMGGDLFAIVYEAKTGKVYGLNSSGWTPKALTIDYLKAKNVDKLDRIGVHAITVPGCVAGWDALRTPLRHQDLSRNFWRPRSSTRRTDSRSPRSGRAPGSPRRCSNSRATRRPTCPAASGPQLGDVFKNPALGESLRQVAAKGRDGYYKGKHDRETW